MGGLFRISDKEGASGGVIPIPKKLRVASIKIAVPILGY
jgi:hypothetical protein